MMIDIKVGNELYTNKTSSRYVSFHRAISTVYPKYQPRDFMIYHKSRLYQHRDPLCKIPGNRIEIELIPRMKGGAKSATSSGMFYFILFLITLSPIYFMYVGIVPLKAFLSRRILTTALEPLGKYLVCVLGKKTLFNRILLSTSIIKYFIFILAVFITFTLPFIVLCVLMSALMKKNGFDSPAKLEKPVNAGYTTGVIFTLIHMLIYFGYRWFDYFADFFISLCNKSYYTRMIFVPPLEAMKRAFNNIKGTGAMIATMGYAADVKVITGAIGGAASSLEGVMRMMIEQGCETVGVDEVVAKFKKGLAELKSTDLSKFEIKGRDRKAFCFDFNEYLDENDLEKLCVATGNEQCCTPSVFYKIAAGMYDAISGSSTFAELIKKGAAMLGVMGHIITANIAFFEEAMERNEETDDAIYLLERQFMIKDHEEKTQKGDVIYESQLDAKMAEYRAMGHKVQVLYDDKFKNYKEHIVGVLNVKRRVSFDEMRNKINELKRMLNDYNASYNDDDVIVKYVFKPYFISNVCEALNGVRATRDFSADIQGLDNAVDILRSGMFTGRWMIVFYLITYLVLVILGFFKVY